MALIKSCLMTTPPATGYDIVELIPVGASGDKTLTVQTGDYLALTDSSNSAYIAGISDITITETSDITISGAVKIYEVTQGTTGVSSTVRILDGGNYGAIVHFRVAS